MHDYFHVEEENSVRELSLSRSLLKNASMIFHVFLLHDGYKGGKPLHYSKFSSAY
jgi:hypothetical protein